MSNDPDSPKVLESFSHDLEAAALVALLQDHGIMATTTGGYTAGFRAEAPGMVHVMVRSRDLSRARQVWAEIKTRPAEVDWPQVDFDDAELISGNNVSYLRHVLDNLFVFVGVLTPEGVLLEANRPPLEAAGISLDDVLGKRFEDCYWWSYSPAVQERIREAIARAAAGHFSRFDIEARMAGGRLMPIDFQLSPLRDATGRITHVVPSAVDITERKQAENALRQSQSDLARAQSVGQIGSWRLNVRCNVLDWSDENYRIFGVPEGTPLTYETFLNTVHPDDRAYVHEKWSAALRGEPYEIEHRVVAEGQVRWVREKAYLEFDETGALQGGFGITQDITRLKQAEHGLLASKNFADKVLDASLNGLYIYDLERRVNTFVNRSYTTFTGYTLDEINALGEESFAELFHPDDRARVEAHMRGVRGAADEAILAIEYRFRTKSHGWRWYLSRDRVFSRDETGSVREFIGTFVDITDRKLAEARLAESQRLGQAINRISRIIHATHDPAEIMQDLVQEGVRALGCETAAISLRREGRWVVQHVEGLPKVLVGSIMDDEEERHAVLALRTRQAVVVEDAWNDDRACRDHMRKHNIRSVLVVPLIVRDMPLGVIFFNYHTAPRRFSEAQVDFAGQLAATASIALENGRLFREHRQAVEALGLLNQTLEAKVVERTAVAERRSQDLRRMAAELGEAERRERKRLAKLLHDDMQQTLMAIRLRLPLLMEMPGSLLKEHVEKIDDLVGECLSASRDLTQELNPFVIQHGTLADVIEWLSEWFGEKYGLMVAVDMPDRFLVVSEQVREILFQAVRELLNNVAKHSGKMEARVIVSSDDAQLVVQVEDEGVDFDPQAVEARLQRPESFGLFSIKERLGALAGRLDFQATPRGGACFRLIVPMPAANGGSLEQA